MSKASALSLSYGRQLVEKDDIDAVAKALAADWLTTGPTVEAFERKFAETVGARHAVACSSGTAALHLAAIALQMSAGDAAVVPTMTFLASANAYRYVGADVVFADVDPDTGLLREQDLRAEMSGAARRGVRAVTAVHLNGQVADMVAIGAAAGEHGLRVVEDACHALGTQYRTPDGGTGRVGDCRFSDLTTFSFHPVKTITTGEGGMVTTNTDDLAERLRRARNHGIVRDPAGFIDYAASQDAAGRSNPWYYEMHELGYNYRITDFQCALGLSQLGKLGQFAAHRRHLMSVYDETLLPLAPLATPLPRGARCDPVLHLYPALVDFAVAGVDRATVMRRLSMRGVGTQVHYYPLHLQPYYRRLYGERSLPGAQRYYERTLSLPFHAGITEEHVRHVVESLRESLQR